MSNNLLKGKKGIIFGALNPDSIAWKVAERAHEEGATLTLTNTPVALRMGETKKLAEKLNTEVIGADATNVDDLNNLFINSMELLGGKIDFVLHSIGMSPNVRKERHYSDLEYIYGRERHVRINTISQSPTITTAGSGVKGFDRLLDFAERMSPLGNATGDECADYCITMFSDLTRKVTMQNLFNDGGFSNMGMSLRALQQYEKGLYTDEKTGKRSKDHSYD